VRGIFLNTPPSTNFQTKPVRGFKSEALYGVANAAITPWVKDIVEMILAHASDYTVGNDDHYRAGIFLQKSKTMNNGGT